MTIFLKRIYQPASMQDGYRVLVDRLWPRGVSKDAAAIDLWLKEAAPSTELRQWFNHEAEKWDAFKARYFAELDNCSGCLVPLLEAIRRGDVTLVYATRDEQHNQAVALKKYIESRL